MTDASGGGDQYPGQRPATADELLADVMPGSAPEGFVTLAEELTTALGGVTTQRSGVELQAEWAADTTRLGTDQTRKILEGHGSRLRGVIDQVFGNEDDKMTDLPPIEQTEQIIKLDTLIRMAAGQPVVILKPGKTWVDIGLLEQPQHLSDNTGLQRSDNLRDTTSSIVLPVYNSVAIDIKTGREPEPEDQQHDDELRARSLRMRDEQGEPTRPVIDPLQTRVLLAAEDARDSQTDPTTAYVLVGYTQLQRTLNRILGFDMSRTDSDQDEAIPKFYSALQIQKRLEETADIVFDIDFIDGYLAYRIDALKQEIRAGGPFRTMSAAYQEAELAEMQQKLARLTDGGWLSKPPAA